MGIYFTAEDSYFVPGFCINGIIVVLILCTYFITLVYTKLSVFFLDPVIYFGMHFYNNLYVM